MDDDATRWDERYRNSDISVAAPPDVLAAHPELLDRIPRTGAALDIACGTGAQALWLAARGLRVTAVDVSPMAVELTRSAAARAGIESIEAFVADLDHGLPDGLPAFDVVVCQRFRHPDLYGPMIDRLRPGGVAVVTVLSAVGLDGLAGPFHAPAGELRTAFARDDVELLLDVEEHGAASVVVLKPR